MLASHRSLQGAGRSIDLGMKGQGYICSRGQREKHTAGAVGAVLNTTMVPATAVQSFWTWTISSAALPASSVLDSKMVPVVAGQLDSGYPISFLACCISAGHNLNNGASSGRQGLWTDISALSALFLAASTQGTREGNAAKSCRVKLFGGNLLFCSILVLGTNGSNFLLARHCSL